MDSMEVPRNHSTSERRNNARLGNQSRTHMYVHIISETLAIGKILALDGLPCPCLREYASAVSLPSLAPATRICKTFRMRKSVGKAARTTRVASLNSCWSPGEEMQASFLTWCVLAMRKRWVLAVVFAKWLGREPDLRMEKGCSAGSRCRDREKRGPSARTDGNASNTSRGRARGVREQVIRRTGRLGVNLPVVISKSFIPSAGIGYEQPMAMRGTGDKTRQRLNFEEAPSERGGFYTPGVCGTVHHAFKKSMACMAHWWIVEEDTMEDSRPGPRRF
ncbi:hypothetical protein P154DRAFT_18610 [Amniculicola lignicola CBS 123094]|uniref:Uncharacterized protein n=1 Tax=Amniculicola lignicola CBS 123094 TaxID=1392246 RepID=A0A6A5X5V6_9PLEO|nr:hypothetical protein P154DRAFT_18610 [Amniculicola lignicola CBS 123094]